MTPQEPAAPRAPVDLAFCVDGRYLRWAAVAALSCVEATIPDRPVRVHVLHDGALDADPGVEAFRTTLARAGAEVAFHRVADHRLAALPAMDRFGAAVWLRFLLPEVLPDVARVLYLDADTYGAASLAPLFDLDLDGRPLGAVANLVEPVSHGHLRDLGFEPDGAFLNSGVLLLDLDRLRAEDGTAQLLEAVRANRERLLWPDQDALNLAFRDRWFPLHPRWNAQNSMWMWPDLAARVLDPAEVDEAVTRPGIVHFEGPSLCKPWHHLCHHPWRGPWWETLRRTPWADTPPEDRTVATRIVKLLPADRQLPVYRRVVQLRAKATGLARRLGRGAPRATPATSIEALLEPHEVAMVERCRPYTLASAERLVATADAVAHVVARGVPGALVECGVWRGGSVLAMVLTLQRLGVEDRDVYLFDTFEGMTEPTAEDTSAFDPPALETFRAAAQDGKRAWDGFFGESVFGLDGVRDLLLGTGYPAERLHFVVGKVEDTVPAQAPERIAVLRLDTDWYESTRHEMTHLYPAVSRGGVLIIDDYGHWEGARRAVEEHFAATGEPLLLARTDYTGRMGVKQ